MSFRITVQMGLVYVCAAFKINTRYIFLEYVNPLLACASWFCFWYCQRHHNTMVLHIPASAAASHECIQNIRVQRCSLLYETLSHMALLRHNVGKFLLLFRDVTKALTIAALIFR